jgi:dihydroxy-acid dehydratase
VPTIVNLMPSGKYLMEEFFYAGGLPVVLKRLGEAGLLQQGRADGLRRHDLGRGEGRQELERRRHPAAEKALTQQGGIAVLKGNLAPNGAVLKPSAATHLMVHRGRAVVFEDIDDYKARSTIEALDIDETCVMVLKNAARAVIPAWPRSAIWACRRRCCEGHHRHGAHFRRAHVRHGLWHGDPAHLAGSGGWRAARHRARRRL